MAKRKRTSKIEKWIQEGRGSGRGSEYIPWLTIQNVSSKGRSTRLKGIKTNRQHEFLSDMERNYFYMLEYSDLVIDIREHFPLLPIEDTILIANELGINHPKDPSTGEYIVMTTKFLVTVRKNNKVYDVARTIKSKDDLFDERIVQRLEIEHEYWRRSEIDWGMVSEKEIDKIFARNISYVHTYKDITQIDAFQQIPGNVLEDLILEFANRLISQTRTLRTIANEFESDMRLPSGSGLSLFYYLIANKIIAIDLHNELNADEIIGISNIPNDVIEKVRMI
ncbi:TnsA endonuclease C-terminal domain-containing protein [Virgibacillus dokdonensis]|uniref:TnsA endonuclease C-terminal domain-containing protein n=1 Tax=Virgibacillus dokdonensis TaxID=302167 RepID=UPI00098A12FC|nr:TnsA endonuclease C-terminal domain-containing protein [Virgibacillus dokdonensis]